MTVDRLVHLFAGVMILLGIALSRYNDENWIFLSIFVAASLAQSGITTLCPLGIVLEKLGIPSDVKDGQQSD